MQVKEIIDSFVLLTYDIPAKERRLRAQFLKGARTIGAVRHSSSVYYMPASAEAYAMAEELAQVGEVFVWISRVSPRKAQELTRKYDAHLKDRVVALEVRATRIEKHRENGKLKLAEKMLRKTWEMVKALENAIQRRGSLTLYSELVLIKNRLEVMA